MRRWTVHITSALSLLLLLATVGLWVDSQWYGRTFSSATTSTKFYVDSRVGVCSINVTMYESPIELDSGLDAYEIAKLAHPEPIEGWLDAYQAGFGYAWDKKIADGIIVFKVLFPHWFLALIFAILPTIWFIKWRHRRALGDNICANCGYDLTGNTTGKCSECGSDIATETSDARV